MDEWIYAWKGKAKWKVGISISLLALVPTGLVLMKAMKQHASSHPSCLETILPHLPCLLHPSLTRYVCPSYLLHCPKQTFPSQPPISLSTATSNSMGHTLGHFNFPLQKNPTITDPNITNLSFYRTNNQFKLNLHG